MHAGFPGTGKSQFTMDIAARITNGAKWPLSESRAPKGTVLVLSAEDNEADTIVPRLKAAEADLAQVEIIRPIVRDTDGALHILNIADDLENISNLIDQMRAEGRDVKLIKSTRSNLLLSWRSKERRQL